MKRGSCRCWTVAVNIPFGYWKHLRELIDQPEGSLELLASRTGAKFPNLIKARTYTELRIEETRTAFAEFADGDDCVVLFGSWARGELTPASDNDWAVVTDQAKPNSREPDLLLERCHEILDRDGHKPGKQGVFGCPFRFAQLTAQIGLNRDSNQNLTRRMLFSP